MATHCSIFALSQPSNPFYSQACSHSHDAFCEGMNGKPISLGFNRCFSRLFLFILDCYLLFQLFDRIEDYVHTTADQEAKDELLYDFQFVWDSIFQLMGHRIRAAQQEQQKKRYLEEIDQETVFLTVD